MHKTKLRSTSRRQNRPHQQRASTLVGRCSSNSTRCFPKSGSRAPSRTANTNMAFASQAQRPRRSYRLLYCQKQKAIGRTVLWLAHHSRTTLRASVSCSDPPARRDAISSRKRKPCNRRDRFELSFSRSQCYERTTLQNPTARLRGQISKKIDWVRNCHRAPPAEASTNHSLLRFHPISGGVVKPPRVSCNRSPRLNCYLASIRLRKLLLGTL